MMKTTSYVLLAVTIVGMISISPAFALEQPCPDCPGDYSGTVELPPLSVWTDRTTYDHEDIINVSGVVANYRGVDTPVTLLVISPTNNIVTIAQLEVDSNGIFDTTLSTSGNLWKYDGTYTIKVQYGPLGHDNKIAIELTGGVTPSTPSTVSCDSNELAAADECHSIVESVSGATVTGVSVDGNRATLTVMINANTDGTITLSPSSEVISEIFMVIVDGEEWDDATINGNTVTIMFLEGAEKIELIGTSAIPEFGTIAAMILAVAIVSIIIVTAKTKTSIIPKY